MGDPHYHMKDAEEHAKRTEGRSDSRDVRHGVFQQCVSDLRPPLTLAQSAGVANLCENDRANQAEIPRGHRARPCTARVKPA
jgi:hypothetical protein